jgi:1,4-dihydroxy-2-naphthoate octaprenyltransferase
MRISIREIGLFIRLTRPLFLLGGILLYGLGGAILDYLGRPIDITLFILGQIGITAIQLVAHFLNEYFDSPRDSENPNRTLLTGGSGALGPGGLPRKVALYGAAFTLAITATIVIFLVTNEQTPMIAWIILSLIFLGAFLYSLPPISLATSGYGEASTSVLVAGLLPAFAFTLQTGEFHRLLVMTSTPLVALHFAMMLAFELPDFATDTKFEKRTLMVRIGWAAAMRLHDFAIIFAIGGVAFAFALGLPWRVALGSSIALPLALAQMWQFSRVRRGFPPNWRTITYSALALFAMTAYLQLVGYLVV